MDFNTFCRWKRFLRSYSNFTFGVESFTLVWNCEINTFEVKKILDSQLKSVPSHPVGSSGSSDCFRLWPFPFESWGYTVWPLVKLRSHQKAQIITRGQHTWCHMPPTHNLPPFLGYKTSILWVADSLQADVNLVWTNLEDCDSLLDNSFADVSLRVHLQQISWVFVWFTILSLWSESNETQ